MNIHDDPVDEEIQELAEQAVTQATENFQQYVFNYTSQATSFAEPVQVQTGSGAGKESLIENAIPEYAFWGVLITRDSTKWLWNDFTPINPGTDSLQGSNAIYVSIGIENNVSFLYSIIPFFVEDSLEVIRYDVHTRVKLSRETTWTGSLLVIQPG